MQYVRPQYSHEEVDRAGRVLIDPDTVWIDEREEALRVVNNWRSSHSFPQNTLWMTLNKYAKRIDPEALVAQRIKRRESIEDKLERLRHRGLTLSQMQDLGGCRAIVVNVPAVRAIVHVLSTNKRIKHKLIRIDDYISNPKRSGYRGVHLIYEFQSAQTPHWNGLNVEIQVRSSLMHTWATAVEIVDALGRQRLKVGGGDPSWARFFALMSTFFANIEGNKPVPKTPKSPTDLRSELTEVERTLKVRDHLAGWRTALRITQDMPKHSRYFVLLLDHGERSTTVWGYRAQQLRAAQEHVRQLEDRANVNAVLVGIETAKGLHRAYPNYFFETGIFLAALDDALGLKRPPESEVSDAV